MSDLAERVSGLTDERRLLLELLRKERRAGGPAAAEKPTSLKPARLQPFELVSEDDRAKLPEGLEDAYPMARMQAGMLYHMELTPEYPLYINVDSWHLRTRFVAGPFFDAVRRVVARHEVLRTSFDLAAYSEPMQLVHREARLPVTVIDIRDVPQELQEALLAEFVSGEKRRFFDLSTPPLLRFHIHIRSEEEFQFTLTNFHPIMDGWSLQATLAEILRHYTSFLQGEALPEEPRLELGYGDFVALERQALASEETRRFWHEILSDAEILRLPRWPAFHRSHEGRLYRRLVRQVPPELFGDLRQLARTVGVPLKSVFVAAHCKALSLLGGRDDIVTGLTVHGRPEGEGGDQLRGLFVNTVPMRLLVGPGTWAGLVRAAFEAERALVAHRRFPLAEMQRGRDQLIEVALNVTHFHVHEGGSPGVAVGHLGGTELEETNFTLLTTFSIDLSGRVLSMALECLRAEIADAQTDLLASHYLAVLQAMAASPDARHETTILLSDRERQQVLREWNLEEAAPVPACLPQLFAGQAARTPDATALVAGSVSLSYAELARRVSRVAAGLVRRGVGPEVLVGLYMERSVDMVVGLLGILAAGGAYVPIDPAAPQERVLFLLENAKVAVLLTQERLLAGLPSTLRESLGGAPVLCLDAPDAQAGSEDHLDELREIGLHPESSAYVIYTSGSTGRPKGVVVTHADVVRLFTATERWFHFGPEDVWTLFHSYAFDFSVWELWGALLYGGRLVVVPQAVARTPEDFLALLRHERVTVLNQTPSAFRQLCAAEEAAPDGGDLALRWVIFGGEALEMGSLAPWFARHGEASPVLVNMYGITETTVHVTYRPLGSGDLAAGSVIGVPIPDLRVYVLDRYGMPVPVGAPGEIHVGGAGLARGYLHRPELTAERFVPDPWSGGRGERLYKSGDLGRFLPDGELEHLGRIDHQVKVRGFRIELGEIEAVLATHPRVRQAVVVARREAGDETRLVGYVVAAPGQALSYEELRRHLRERLPDYMVPAALVLLDTLPLTVNGKVDRRALPAPDGTRPDLEEAYVAPRTPVEEALAASWAEVLGIEQVGVNDNFFALGGDSMRILQVLARARNSGLEFSLQQVYEHQTLGQLAAVTTLLPSEEEVLLEVPSQEELPQTRPFGLLSAEDLAKLPEGVVDAYPLARMQAGMLFHMEMTPDYPLYHNVDSWHLRARFEEGPFRTAVERVVARHPILRTAFDLTTFSEPMQLVYGEAAFPVGVDDLRQLDPVEQEAVIARFVEAAKRDRFDYTRPPLLRFHIHLRAESSFQFTLTEFHPILDGWSLQSTLAEILGLYSDLLEGGAVPPEKPLRFSYREFIYLEQMALRSEEFRSFWQTKLRGASALRLPRWPSPFRNRGGRLYNSFEMTLPAGVLEGLRRVSRQAGVPLKSLFLAAHAKVLSRLSGQRDILTGMVVHGRPEAVDGDQVRGLLLNTLPVRLELSGGTWIELARAAFAAECEIVPYRRFPFAELQRQWGREAMLETALNVTHFHVYEKVVQKGEKQAGLSIGSLGGRTLEENNFALSTNFDLATFGTRLHMTLLSHRSELADEQVVLIGRYYVQALSAMAETPQARHDEHSLLAEDEMHLLLQEWNDTVVERAVSRSLDGLIEAQCQLTPDAVAVVSGGAQMTYRELAARAGRLAGALRDRGVGPEVRVGVCVERSFEMMVALFGVLKAGGAYLPLDPSYPADRLAFMLADAGVSVVLTQEHLLPVLPDPASVPGNRGPEVLCLDRDWDAIAQSRSWKSQTENLPEQAAYVIYTSGSTGRPKGVVNAHRAIVNRLLWMLEAYGLNAADRVLQKTPFSFDVSIWELFSPLLVGGRLVMAKPGGHQDSGYLASLIAEQGITTCHFVPSMLQLFVEESDLGRCKTLRRVVCSGEALPAELARRFAARLGDLVGAELYNFYGPTEAAVEVTAWPCAEDRATPSIPIGRPIANLQIHLVDAAGSPVPVGVAGELLIGGMGVARGYLGRPDLTAERFVPDPFAARLDKVPGARVYRTGDVARYLPDGSIEFLGRLDHQVKVRGFRIELGEIEAALAAFPGTREAVVMAREDTPGDKRLVAYLVPESGSDIAVPALRDHLRQQLPDYMVPTFFLLLDALPLGPSGKVNRAALPPPGELTLGQAQAYIPPRNQLEHSLVALWQETLQVDRVGIDDNFFDLGGHSLLLIRLHRKLVQLLGVQLSLTDLLRYASVGALAAYLSRENVSAESQKEGGTRGDARKAAASRQAELREKRRTARSSKEVRNG